MVKSLAFTSCDRAWWQWILRHHNVACIHCLPSTVYVACIESRSRGCSPGDYTDGFLGNDTNDDFYGSINLACTVYNTSRCVSCKSMSRMTTEDDVPEIYLHLMLVS